jgi:hypothetical protein
MWPKKLYKDDKKCIQSCVSRMCLYTLSIPIRNDLLRETQSKVSNDHKQVNPYIEPLSPDAHFREYSSRWENRRASSLVQSSAPSVVAAQGRCWCNMFIFPREREPSHSPLLPPLYAIGRNRSELRGDPPTPFS